MTSNRPRSGTVTSEHSRNSHTSDGPLGHEEPVCALPLPPVVRATPPNEGPAGYEACAPPAAARTVRPDVDPAEAAPRQRHTRPGPDGSGCPAGLSGPKQTGSPGGLVVGAGVVGRSPAFALAATKVFGPGGAAGDAGGATASDAAGVMLCALGEVPEHAARSRAGRLRTELAVVAARMWPTWREQVRARAGAEAPRRGRLRHRCPTATPRPRISPRSPMKTAARRWSRSPPRTWPATTGPVHGERFPRARRQRCRAGARAAAPPTS